MNDNYATPKWLMDIFKDWYDPCTLSKGEFRMQDGLGDWQDRTFVNPPYSNPMPWIKKAIEESAKGKTIVLLLRCVKNKSANFPSMLAIFNKRKDETLPIETTEHLRVDI
jgi:hypothetical protein